LLKSIFIKFIYFFYKFFWKIKWFFRKKKIISEEEWRLIKFMKQVWNIDCVIDKKNYYYFDFKEYDKQKKSYKTKIN